MGEQRSGPLFFTAWAGWPDVDWLIMVEFVAAAIPLSIVMTWFFNRTGESLPVVLLLHAGINTAFSQAWPAMFPTLDPFETLYAFSSSRRSWSPPCCWYPPVENSAAQGRPARVLKTSRMASSPRPGGMTIHGMMTR